MGEWECLLVAKASLGQEKTRVLVEIQWTMGDLTLKLHAQPRSINLNKRAVYLNRQPWLYASHNPCISMQALSVYPPDELQALQVGRYTT